MDTWSAILVPLFFLAVACVLLVMHSRAWRAARDVGDAEERDYRRRQFRRRMQTSGMLALAAAALLVGQAIPRKAPVALVIGYWGGVVLLVVWIGLLAVADIICIKQYYGRIRADHLVQRAKLQAQLRRAQAARRNGHDENGHNGEDGRRADGDERGRDKGVGSW